MKTLSSETLRAQVSAINGYNLISNFLNGGAPMTPPNLHTKPDSPAPRAIRSIGQVCDDEHAEAFERAAKGLPLPVFESAVKPISLMSAADAAKRRVRSLSEILKSEAEINGTGIDGYYQASDDHGEEPVLLSAEQAQARKVPTLAQLLNDEAIETDQTLEPAGTSDLEEVKTFNVSRKFLILK